MNLDALNEIITNNPEIIERRAEENSANPEMVKGIASLVIDKGYEILTSNQKYHFDKSILPLIENVKCDGYSINTEDDPNECQMMIDDSNLKECYINQEFYCETCAEEQSFHANRYDSIMNQ